jgi:hypothetical protein
MGVWAQAQDEIFRVECYIEHLIRYLAQTSVGTRNPVKTAVVTLTILIAVTTAPPVRADQYDDIEAAINRSDIDKLEALPQSPSPTEIAFDAMANYEKCRIPREIFGSIALLHGLTAGVQLITSEGAIEVTPLFVFFTTPSFDVLLGTWIGNTKHWRVHWGAMALELNIETPYPWSDY